MSTHILSEAEATCDRIVIINHGKIVANDSTAKLKESISGASMVNVTLQNADISSVKKQFESLEGITAVSLLEEVGDQITVGLTISSKMDHRAGIYNSIKQSDWVLLDFHQETQTLENIFRQLTKEN